LWSGIGCASAYAGGTDRRDIEAIYSLATPYRLQLARGAAIAAKGREQASNFAPHTEIACEVFCGTSSIIAAHIADIAQEGLPLNNSEPAYELWRQRIQAQFAIQAQTR
jgi:hypothetical protein